MIKAVVCMAVVGTALEVAATQEVDAVNILPAERGLDIRIGSAPFAAYVFADNATPRPYLHTMHAPNGYQVTRNHPPIPGMDSTDHATYHPGVWLAFGDINGADFWRNRARIVVDRLLALEAEKPGHASFKVVKHYMDHDNVLGKEVCTYTIVAENAGRYVLIDSKFVAGDEPMVFGDQEEMGFGVRLATALTVENGGRILNSDGDRNEAEAWGQQAEWCEYSGLVDGTRTGIVLMAHPGNFRQSWFHARDYGLLLANPFGRRAFTDGEPSKVVVQPGDSLRLRFGLFVFSTAKEASLGGEAYARYLELADN